MVTQEQESLINTPQTASLARWYFLGVIAFVIPMGIQTVIFPWLIAIELQLGPKELGLGQMALQVPALFLILVGGYLADRLDPRNLLISVHLLAMLPPLALTVVIARETLSFGGLILFALSMGIVTAFSQPARDKLLNLIAGDEIQKTVTLVMGLTFGAQILGYGVASFTEQTGAVPLLLLMAVGLGFGAVAASRLPSAEPASATSSGMLASIREGLDIVRASERMRASLIMLACIGMFYGGTFMVLNPLMVRDFYAGGAQQISLSFAMFMTGTVVTTIVLVTTGGLKNPGKGLMWAVFVGGIMLLLAVFQTSFMGYLFAILGWGCCGGVAMSMGRTIIQELAPESHRARVMSVLSLANVGSLPFGSALMGFCAEYLGIVLSFILAVGGAWLAVLYVATRTRLAHLEV